MPRDWDVLKECTLQLIQVTGVTGIERNRMGYGLYHGIEYMYGEEEKIRFFRFGVSCRSRGMDGWCSFVGSIVDGRCSMCWVWFVWSSCRLVQLCFVPPSRPQLPVRPAQLPAGAARQAPAESRHKASLPQRRGQLAGCWPRSPRFPLFPRSPQAGRPAAMMAPWLLGVLPPLPVLPVLPPQQPTAAGGRAGTAGGKGRAPSPPSFLHALTVYIYIYPHLDLLFVFPLIRSVRCPSKKLKFRIPLWIWMVYYAYILPRTTGSDGRRRPTTMAHHIPYNYIRYHKRHQTCARKAGKLKRTNNAYKYTSTTTYLLDG